MRDLPVVILAAGRGIRLGRLGKIVPKALLQVGGATLLEHSVRCLHALGLRRIFVITGHLDHAFVPVQASLDATFELLHHPGYALGGNLSTLACGLHVAEDELLVMDSDILYEQRALHAILEDGVTDTVLVSGPTGAGDEVYVAGNEGHAYGLTKNRELIQDEIAGEYVGIARLSRSTLEYLVRIRTGDSVRDAWLEYDMDGLDALAKQGRLGYVKVEDLVWGEADDVIQLDRLRTKVFPRIRESIKPKSPAKNLKPIVASRYRLGNSELSRYLEQKEETGRLSCTTVSCRIERALRSLPPKPRVCLASPAISIPKGMTRRCIPPLGLSLIAGALEREGIEVSMVDLVVEGYDEQRPDGQGLITYGLGKENGARAILDTDPDLVGVSVLFSTDLNHLLELCCELRRLSPDLVIVVGGLHPTIYPQEVLTLAEEAASECGLPRRVVDYIIRGEGEQRLPKLVADLVHGVIDVSSDGLVGESSRGPFFNHQRTTITDLDALALPAYHLLPMERYFDINVPFSPVPKGRRVMQLLTSRGCPVSCSFCASTNLYKAYRVRSVESVISEVCKWKDIYSIDEVQFADDNLLLDRRRAVELFTRFAELELPWCTPNGIMVNTLDPELLELLHSSGLYQITLSIDSGSRKTLKDHHHKPVNLDRVPNLIAHCEALGIFTHGTLVVGMPGETMDDIEETFNYVRGLRLTSLSTFLAAPIPGSELFHRAVDDGLVGRAQARRIDTTRSTLWNDPEQAARLQERVFAFQAEYSESVKRRDPETWRRKYGRLLDVDPEFDRELGGRLT